MNEDPTATPPAPSTTPEPPTTAGVKAMRASVATMREQLIAGGLSAEKADALVAPSVEAAEKCMVAVDSYRPYGGATSFAELDNYLEANERAGMVDQLAWRFQNLVENIMAEEGVSLADKAARVASAAGELQTRVGEIDTSSATKERGLLGRLVDRVLGGDSKAAPPEPERGEGIEIAGGVGIMRSFKDSAGELRWVGIWSTTKTDSVGERFTEAAHRDFIAWADKSGHMPELWLWHTPGTRIGVTDMLDIHNGVCVATGTFDEGAKEIAERLGDGDGMSHGYLYRLDEKVAGTFHRYRTYELSVLPRARAAIKTTDFMPLQEAITMDATKEKYLREKMGDAKVDAFKERIDAMTKELDAEGVGIAFKDMAEILAPSAANADGAAAPQAPAPSAADPAPAPAPVVEATKAEPPAPTPTGDAPPLTAESIVAALKEANGPLVTSITNIEARLDANDAKLAALAEKDDAKIAAAFAPKAGDPQAPVAVASVTTDAAGSKGVAEDQIEGSILAIIRGQKEDDASKSEAGAAVLPYIAQFAGHGPVVVAADPVTPGVQQ